MSYGTHAVQNAPDSLLLLTTSEVDTLIISI